MKPKPQETNDDQVVSTTTEHKKFNPVIVEDRDIIDSDQQQSSPSTSTSFKIHLKRRSSSRESYNYDEQPNNSESVGVETKRRNKHKASHGKRLKCDPNLMSDDIQTGNSPNSYMNRSILKKSRNSELSDDDNTQNLSDTVKIKKKVRIDETEGLKAKQELSHYETHFSVKALPAKIMKSKLNRAYTEEVKISPITIRSGKHEKKDKKKKKKKHKRHSSSSTESKLMEAPEEVNELVEEVNGANENPQEAEELENKEVFSMNKEDQCILLQKLRNCIPANDNENFGYRLNHLNWQNVTFKNYTSEICRNECIQLLKNVRQYRLLGELIADAQTNIENDAHPVTIEQSYEKHPDMPKKPLSSYFIFYLKKKDKIAKEHPGSDASTLSKIVSQIYSKMSLEKKRKYEELAAKNRKQYEQDLQNFYNLHPECRNKTQRRPKSRKDNPPKKPDTPYNLFVKSELRKEIIDDRDKAEFKHFCKEKWEHMPDDKKLLWINLAEEQNEKYQGELNDYIKRHPNYVPKVSSKSVLSKKEAELKDKLAGKPKKPPSTAYSFFVSAVLQSPEISGIPIKERMNYCSAKWKKTSQEDKEKYRQMFTEAHAQYDRNFEIYLHSLPEEKRKVELLVSNSSKKKKIDIAKTATNIKGVQKVIAKRGRPPKVRQTPPIAPPRSLFKYFASRYEGDDPREAWIALSRSVKKTYKKERIAAQSEYLKEYELYLKSLKKDELKAFCEQKKMQEQNSSSENSDSGDNLSSDDESFASVDNE